MRYLLDVNALVAFGFQDHQFHPLVRRWLGIERPSAVFTCSITELGFVRVLAQVRQYGFSVESARELLLRLKKDTTTQLTFIEDANDITHLPDWASTPRQTTDAHLVQLALAHNARLATLDSTLPGAYQIL